jgi:hypothetical protein
MAKLCIPKPVANRIKEALKGKDLTVGQLLDMTSVERIETFNKLGFTNSKEVNTLFESKLVLKNVFVGIKNFLSKVAQINKYSPEKVKQLQAEAEIWKSQQEERTFNPKEGETFLSSLVEKVVGTELTQEQSKELIRLTQLARNLLEEGYNKETKTWSSDKVKSDYGAARVAQENFIENLKTRGLTLKEMLSERLQQYKTDTKEVGVVKSTANLLMDTLKALSNSSIALVASFDNSFMGRQGLNTLMTNPKIWYNFSRKSFSDFVQTLGGVQAKDALWIDIYSNPLYIDGTFKKAGILPKTEEQYPTTLPQRIPLVGRILEASEQAFVGSAIRARTQLLQHHLDVSKKNGVEITDKHIESLGKLVNSLTARGQWGKRGEPAIVRILLWAPKMLKGNLDVLTGMQLTDVSPEVKKIAAKNLLKIVGVTALTMMIAEAMKPGSVEDDPRSSDFGKIVVGNTRFDITGGKASIVTLAFRIARRSYKSTKTGEIIEYGVGYGQKTPFDILVDFLTNKSAPPTRVVIDLLKGQNFEGEKTTIPNVLYSLTTPISIQNAIELKDDSSAQAVLGAILDVIGVNANTYIETTDWNVSSGMATEAFREKVGETKFKEANKEYNNRLQEWWNAVKVDVRFQELTPETKQKVITNKKTDLKEKIMKEYGFVYKRAKPTKTPKF